MVDKSVLGVVVAMGMGMVVGMAVGMAVGLVVVGIVLVGTGRWEEKAPQFLFLVLAPH